MCTKVMFIKVLADFFIPSLSNKSEFCALEALPDSSVSSKAQAFGITYY